MRKFLVFCTGFLLSLQSILAQVPEKMSAADIYHSLQKLNFLGNALYIAAHPDDENTRLISYLSNEVKARTGYLSITRGDGGQNLIGSELRELLGVLRTQELLAARDIDGGEQFFTRAVDFGFSKHPKETLEIWNEEDVLGDVVWVIRNLRPDVIINRFDHRTPGSTHGHHTSSAILSVKAFDLAADQSAYPEQLEFTDTWQPKRVFFNTSWWFYGSQENFEKADKSNMVGMDVGVYYPLLGLSNNEIASLASSQHLCQGFGRNTDRGSEMEYVELLKGEMPGDISNIFEGIDTSWSRLEGGDAVGEILYEVEQHFNFKDPSSHLSQLIEAHKRLQKVPDGHWKHQKNMELEALISAVCGLYLEASAKEASAFPGDDAEITIEAVNRSPVKITLKAIHFNNQENSMVPVDLSDNKKYTTTMALNIPKSTPYTSPYWLAQKGSLGQYHVSERSLIGKPETPPGFTAVFDLDIDGYSIGLESPVIHKYSKPDKGELSQPFDILPRATARISDPVLIFADGEARPVVVTVKSQMDGLDATLRLHVSDGWAVREPELPVRIANKGEEKSFLFTLIPPGAENESSIRPELEVNGETVSKELVTIAYDHIPTQSVLLPSETRVVRLDIEKAGENVGYIVGAGDNIPESLEQIGYKVDRIDPLSITRSNLRGYDAIVVGIRAYNVVEELKFKQGILLDYVKDGGTLVVQYNTVWRNDLGIDNLAPYPLDLSRDRVADENSEVTILAPGHPLMQFPNRITESDFDGWVQERGLYFPDGWDSTFTPILSMHDEGEDPKKGSLLVAPYGEGYYIYTGLSFFRELPAGVPGAYKLFANMLSVGSNSPQNANAVKG
jgi:LmbE family N-acetylglucosaminyl deacetylase